MDKLKCLEKGREGMCYWKDVSYPGSFFVVVESEYEAIRKLIKLFLRNYLFDIVLFKVASYPGSSLAPPKNNNFAGEEPGYDATFKN